MPMILDSPISEKPPMDEKQERREVHHDADVVIIGAGVVGTAMAVAMGKQGRSVILLERSLKEPDRIVGELMQPGGVQALEELGLADCMDGIDSVPCKGYEVIYHGQRVNIPYPEDTHGVRPEGRCFHHGRFIQRLRAAAMSAPNVTVVESTATGLIKNGWTGQVLGVEAKTADTKDFYFAHLTVVCDGYASKFRKEFHTYTPTVRSKFWALELIDADMPNPYHGHVIISDIPPVLLYQIGTHETRALIDVPENLPSAAPAAGGIKNHLRNVVLPQLPESVRPSFIAAIDSGKFRSMPNSFLPPAVNRTPGMIIVGDALNMRHPLTGGGMTVAFNDVVLLRDLLSPEQVPQLQDTKLVLKQMKKFHWQRKGGSSAINILSMALYSLFAANDHNLKALQRGCFEYFKRGGVYISEPAGLLAGLIREPMVLFWHFFNVAFYAIWVKLRDAGVLGFPVALVSAVTMFWTACMVICPFMLWELRS